MAATLPEKQEPPEAPLVPQRRSHQVASRETALLRSSPVLLPTPKPHSTSSCHAAGSCAVVNASGSEVSKEVCHRFLFSLKRARTA